MKKHIFGVALVSILSLTDATHADIKLVETGATQTEYVALQAPSSIASNITFIFPGSDGSAYQSLMTNGAGVLSWRTPFALAADDGSPAQALYVNSTGNVGVGTTAPSATLEVAGHLASSGGTPGIGSCGTSPSISGTDTRGQLQFGTGSPTSCTITFAAAYSTAPYCVVSAYQSNPGAIYWLSSVSTTGFIVNLATGNSNQRFHYFCIQ